LPRSPFWGIDSAGNLGDKAATLEYYRPDFVQEGETMNTSRKCLSVVLVAFSLAFAVTGLARALQVGDKAPDFELDSTKGGKLKLSDLRGKNVLINFYRNDFDPT
jgi:hypothetical protein